MQKRLDISCGRKGRQGCRFTQKTGGSSNYGAVQQVEQREVIEFEG